MYIKYFLVFVLFNQSFSAQISEVKKEPESVKMVPESVKKVPESAKILPESANKKLPESVKQIPESVKIIPESGKLVPKSVKRVQEIAKMVPKSSILVPESVKIEPEGKITESKEYNEIKLEPKFGFFPHVKFVELIEIPEESSSSTTTTTTTQDPAVVREMLCNSFGGLIVNTTLCYEYIEGNELTFEDATNFCLAKGGQLWVPQIYDPNLSFILFEELPKIYAETFGETLWIGIENIDDSFVSSSGQVFDDHPLLAPFLDYDDYYFDNECVVLYITGNMFELLPVDCDFSERNFVCEYVV